MSLRESDDKDDMNSDDDSKEVANDFDQKKIEEAKGSLGGDDDDDDDEKKDEEQHRPVHTPIKTAFNNFLAALGPDKSIEDVAKMMQYTTQSIVDSAASIAAAAARELETKQSENTLNDDDEGDKQIGINNKIKNAGYGSSTVWRELRSYSTREEALKMRKKDAPQGIKYRAGSTPPGYNYYYCLSHNDETKCGSQLLICQNKQKTDKSWKLYQSNWEACEACENTKDHSMRLKPSRKNVHGETATGDESGKACKGDQRGLTEQVKSYIDENADFTPTMIVNNFWEMHRKHELPRGVFEGDIPTQAQISVSVFIFPYHISYFLFLILRNIRVPVR